MIRGQAYFLLFTNGSQAYLINILHELVKASSCSKRVAK